MANHSRLITVLVSAALALLGMACDAPGEANQEIAGPALVMFYTDN